MSFAKTINVDGKNRDSKILVVSNHTFFADKIDPDTFCKEKFDTVYIHVCEFDTTYKFNNLLPQQGLSRYVEVLKALNGCDSTVHIYVNKKFLLFQIIIQMKLHLY